jgi:hypothetical protein
MIQTLTFIQKQLKLKALDDPDLEQLWAEIAEI